MIWWFDLDILLFDFIFDFILCITYLFIFVINFFVRLFFSFVFVVLFLNQFCFLAMSLLYVRYILYFVLILYSFVCFFFASGIAFVLLGIEFFAFTVNLLYLDFLTFSSDLNLHQGPAPVPIFCNFLFCLYYFLIVLIWTFLFFVIRCLFVLNYDVFCMVSDKSMSILALNLIHLDFLYFCILFLGFIFCFVSGLFSFLWILNLNFLVLYFMINIFFGFLFVNSCKWALLINSTFMLLLMYCRVLYASHLSILYLFRFIWFDAFFVFIFVFVLLVICFFGFFVKDFLFLSIYFDFINHVFILETQSYLIFTTNRLNSTILSLITVY